MDFSAWDADKAATIVEAQADRPGALLPILHGLNETFGCVPEAAIPIVARALNLTRAEVRGVVSFYHDFRRAPPPRRRLQLCRAEACQARGGEALAAAIGARLSGRADVAVEAVYCLGLCASGPAAMVDGRPYARLDAGALERLLAEP